MQRLLAHQLNKGAAHPKNQAAKIIQILNIRPGQKIVDLGSGGGFFTFEFSKLVGPTGKIYPVDTNTKFLKYIKDKIQQQLLTNIEPVLVNNTSILPFPANSIDLLFSRDVYHHLKNRITYLKNILPVLKPDGQVIIIDYANTGIKSFLKVFGHYTAKHILLAEMQQAGYTLVHSYDFLDNYLFTIFQR